MSAVRSPLLRLALTIALLGVWALHVPSSAYAWGQPGLVPGVPSDVRSPKIAGEGGRVHMITYQAKDMQLLYSRGITAADGSVRWERPRRIADDVKLAWNIAADTTGTVHVAYATNDRRIYYIKNASRGDVGYWTRPELVTTIGSQANELDIALDNANTPYVAWGQGVDDSTLNVSYRGAGSTWITSEVAGRAYLYRYAALAVSGEGAAARVHIMTERKNDKSSQLEILYASGPRDGPFDVRAFSGSFGIGELAAQPTLALDRLTGVIYTGFFSGGDLDFQFLFSFSRDNGASWAPITTTRLGDNLVVTEKSPMVAGNNRAYIMLQVKRVGNGGFSASGFYATEFNPDTQTFTPPAALRDVRGTDYKNVSPDLAINTQAKVGVWVPGFTAGAAYNSEPGGIAVVSADAIALNGGAPFTRTPNVAITVVNPKGGPTAMRVAIDTPLSAATPSEPFQASFTRALPVGCQHTVSVQLLKGGDASDVLTDTIGYDPEVTASLQAINPHEGDPGYTREPSYRLQVIGAGECSGLASVSVGASAPIAIANNEYDAVQPLPAPVQQGANPLAFQLADVAGNTRQYSATLIYDPTPPVLVSTGKLTVTVPTSGTNVLARLDFAGNAVRDAGYGGRGFWGVQLLNSRAPISDTARADLPWTTVRAPGDASDFALRDWGLLSGIAPAQRTPGAYYVYARFIDGAGNATTGVISGTATLGELRGVEVRLPLGGK